MRDLKIANGIKIVERSFITSRYYNDINKNPLMTAQQEYEAFCQLRKGDLTQKERIIKANLRFVISCAKQYIGTGVNIDDLISEGNYGLIIAVDRFDHTKGFKFISYAVSWIRQQILFYLSEHLRTIRLPHNVSNKLQKVRDSINKMEQLNGFSDIGNICEELGVKDSVVDLALMEYPVTSTSSTIPGDAETTVEDTLGEWDDTESMIDNGVLKEGIEVALKTLPVMEADIVRQVSGLEPYQMPVSMEVVAMRYGYESKTSIQKIYTKALAKLKRRILSSKQLTEIAQCS